MSIKIIPSKVTWITILVCCMNLAWANMAVKIDHAKLSHVVLTLQSITPQKKEIFGTDDRLYIGVAGNKCTLKSSQKKSNIENVTNHLTGYTLLGFANSFSLTKPITCLKLEITYHGKLFTTGDIQLTKKGAQYTAKPNFIKWDFTKP